MKRRLIVMRHAKSSWSSPAPTDHERPLNKRGQRDAPRVGAALVQAGWVPQLVLSSDSQRTRETFAGLLGSFPETVGVTYLPSFYHGGTNAVREEVTRLGDELECVLVLGHNPGWEQIVGALTGEGVVMKTATAALLARDLPHWHRAFEPASWTLERVIYPREL